MKESSAYKEPSPAAGGRPVLMLVEGSRGMRSARSRNGALPAPALRSPMLLVVGGRDHHAATLTTDIERGLPGR